MDFARTHTTNPITVAAISTVTPTYPQTVVEMPDIATDSAAAVAPPSRPFRDAIAYGAYEEAGLGPDDLDLAEVYDLSSALELDWYENIGLCAEGEAEKLLNDGDTTIGGRIPVNPSGGLGCFGEAVPAQAIAQVCEVTWQLRGEAGDRQVGGRPGRAHGQPGPVRPRLVGDSHALSDHHVRRSDHEHLLADQPPEQRDAQVQLDELLADRDARVLDRVGKEPRDHDLGLEARQLERFDQGSRG